MPRSLGTLIVEDSEDDALLLARELRRGGYEVTAERVDTAAAMKSALAHGGWDVVIADYAMPQFSGLAALQILKDSGLDLPFIIVSGAIGEDVAVEAMRCGAHDYLMKDKLARLAPAVERELREAEVRRQRRQAEESLRRAHAELEHRVQERTRELARANEELRREIGERKQAEQERGRFLQQLEAERARLETVLRHMPAGVLTAEAPSGRIVFANEQMRQIWRRKQLPTVSPIEYRKYCGCHKDGRPYRPEEWPLARALRQGVVIEDEEVSILRGDNSCGTVAVSAAPIRDADGRIIAAVAMFHDVTARKEAEDALRESEALFRTMVAASPLGVFRTDARGECQYVNARYQEIWGISEAQALGSGWVAGVHPEDRERVFRNWHEAARTRSFYEDEERFLHADGTIVWSSVKAAPVLDGQTLLGYVGTVEDITERRRAAAELRALNEQLEERVQQRTALIALLHDVASAANRAATFEEALQLVLRRVCEHHGWCFGHALRPSAQDPEELTLAAAYYEQSPPWFAESLTVAEQSRWRRGVGLPGRVYASGQAEWTTDVPGVLAWPRTDIARALGLQTALAFPVVVGDDVVAVLEFYSEQAVPPDERTMAAMSSIGTQLGRVVERERAREALREQSRQLEAFFRHSITPLVFLDKQYNFIRVNEAYARACQRDAAEFPGRNHFDLYPSDTKRLFDEVVRTRQPMQVIARPFVFADHPEWGVTYWDWTLVPLLDDAGEIEFLVFSLVDVTERKRAEEQLRRSERLASMGTFAAGIAHEVNNPLASILLTARLALRAVDDRRVAKRSLKEIIEDAERCARIVKAVLRFARREPTEKSAQDLNRLVRGVRQLTRKAAHERGVQVRFELAENLPAVLANATEVEQVLTNLVTNAAQASRPRQSVLVRTQGSGQRVQLCVQDQGRGMTPEEREHAFDPFFTTRALHGGSGLGLSMVHGIVTDHGGTIQIDSQPDRGTTITVELPTAPVPATTAPRKRRARRSRSPIASRTKRRQTPEQRGDSRRPRS